MADAAIHDHDHHDDRGFFTRWFMSTNHKDIGILYLIFSAFAGFISVAMTIYMRLELMHPGVQYMCLEGFMADPCTPNGHLWNVMITYHGVLMMFFLQSLGYVDHGEQHGSAGSQHAPAFRQHLPFFRQAAQHIGMTDAVKTGIVERHVCRAGLYQRTALRQLIAL